VTTRLNLICHASTSATSRTAFAQDEPLDERGLAQASAIAGTLGHQSSGRATVGIRGPALRCEQTAAALGVQARVDPDLADWDLGLWQGHTLAEVSAEHPGDVTAWLTDPGAAPHGGQSLEQLLQRVGGWLDQQTHHHGRLTAVTHAAVIRAALVHALGAPPEAFWRLDVAPLARATPDRCRRALEPVLPPGRSMQVREHIVNLPEPHEGHAHDHVSHDHESLPSSEDRS